MRIAGRMAAELLVYLGEHVKAGIATMDLEVLSRAWIHKHKVRSATLNYKGFPATICTSVNNVVCHGIPSHTAILNKGDIINIDVTLIVNGYHGDVSRTFIIPPAPPHVHALVTRTEQALMHGINAITAGKSINVIGTAIEKFIKPFHYGIVSALCGHGIGEAFHEDPFVMHIKQRRKGARLLPGMTFTVEPMINAGSAQVYTSAEDGWSVFTRDDMLSAQFEHTIAVLEQGCEILTAS